MKVTLTNGMVVEVANAKELAQVVRELRELEAATQPQARAPVRTPKEPEETEQEETDDDEQEEDESGEPSKRADEQRLPLMRWTRSAAHSLVDQLTGQALEVFHLLLESGSAWSDSDMIQDRLGIHRQGTGSVLVPFKRIATELQRPKPLEVEKGRSGKARTMRVRLTTEFLTAYRGASSSEANVQ